MSYHFLDYVARKFKAVREVAEGVAGEVIGYASALTKTIEPVIVGQRTVERHGKLMEIIGQT